MQESETSRVRQSNLFVLCRNRKGKSTHRRRNAMLCCGKITAKREKEPPPEPGVSMQTSLFCKCLEVLCHNFVPFARCTPRIFWCYSFIRFPKPFITIFGELLFDSSIACRLNVFSFSNKKLISIIFTKKYINLPIQMIEILRFRQE